MIRSQGDRHPLAGATNTNEAALIEGSDVVSSLLHSSSGQSRLIKITHKAAPPRFRQQIHKSLYPKHSLPSFLGNSFFVSPSAYPKTVPGFRIDGKYLKKRPPLGGPVKFHEQGSVLSPPEIFACVLVHAQGQRTSPSMGKQLPSRHRSPLTGLPPPLGKGQLHPEVPPQVLHFIQVPLRTSV